MAAVKFEVLRTIDASSRIVWEELIDWYGHGEWIPATWIETDAPDPTAVGAHFTAFTGYGRLALEDRMKVVQCDWDEATQRGECEVSKLGPVLHGGARFTVTPNDDGCEVRWIEDVTVRYLPGFLSPVAAKVGAAGFTRALGRLAKLLASKPSPASPS